ncbi:MAG: sulfite exporter TauE/SafE family protein [Bacteriovoracaceae bacterium]|nr:sulfite exporter TauE/SafE family protein [Bacteriovoracaceae bacterium]
MHWKNSLLFLVAVTVGAVIGAQVTPFLPKLFFKWAIIFCCPFLLAVLLKKDSLVQMSSEHRVINPYLLLVVGLLVGFYDGFFGPGGGVFMLLALIWQVKLPLMDALVLSKLANSLTAGSSLISYTIQGYVDWKLGCLMAVGMIIGSFVGAKLNNKHSVKIMRPVLILVICSLMVRLIFYA